MLKRNTTMNLSVLAFRRRRAFPVLMLGALMTSAALASKAYEPLQNFEYLNELVPQTTQVFASDWTDAGIEHSEKLAASDKATFLALIESADFGLPTGSTRPVYIGQAESANRQNQCQSQKPDCQMSVRLNRQVSPNYIHGDLRMVSVTETALRRDYDINSVTGSITKSEEFKQRRQMRFMLTQRGWVQTTSETQSIEPLAKTSSIEIDTSKYAGLNYYPRTAPWDEFWEEFPAVEIEKDLEFIESLGVNALRIFVNHAYFTDGKTRDDGLAKLDTFLNWSLERDIKVIVTLFDLRADYRLTNWSMDSAHIRDIIRKVGKHKALLAIDLKNQPDLDFKDAGQEQVKAWLLAMRASIRYENPNVPVTIGWSDPDHADLLAENVDYISYHDYRPPSGARKRFNDVKNRLKSRSIAKPVLLTEIGHSRWGLLGESVQKQERSLSTQLEQFGDAQGVFLWTLHDFDHVGTQIVGRRPWRRAQQKVFGITKDNYTLLPSGEAFKSFTTKFLIQTPEISQ